MVETVSPSTYVMKYTTLRQGGGSLYLSEDGSLVLRSLMYQ
jgi:hypothetical protein